MYELGKNPDEMRWEKEIAIETFPMIPQVKNIEIMFNTRKAIMLKIEIYDITYKAKYLY